METKIPWTHKDETVLIDLVQQYPPLWDTSDKNYSKKSIKKCFFQLIAEELERTCPNRILTADNVRRKFGRLRSYFYREMKKIESGDLLPKWAHFDKLMFLAENYEKEKVNRDMNNSLLDVKEVTNDDVEMEHTITDSESSCSDSNKGNDSLESSELPVLSNENSESSKQRNFSISSPVCDSTKTDTPVILKARSNWNGNEATHHKLSLRSKEKESERANKKRRHCSSPVIDSNKMQFPMTLNKRRNCNKEPSEFIMALGNLVVASLNQMPAEKANAATKDIFDVLMKYGSESNQNR